MKLYTDIWFEDFQVGRIFETGSRQILESEIITFGKDFAPLPYHTDPEDAKNYMFGELVAAGFHTCSLAFGLFIKSGIFDACAMGSPGFNKLRWKKPVRPNDILSVKATVTETSPAKNDQGRNLICLLFETSNQHGEVVLEMETRHFVKSRPPSG
jgi:acyl dehydratase